MNFKLEYYQTSNGKLPFQQWLDALDSVPRIRLLARLRRIESGNFGDWKPIKGSDGVEELREAFGPGYRIYYARIEGKIVLLLAGSSKGDQTRVIAKATSYLEDYRKNN
ncbi:MAG: addiction module killer protein [Rhizobium sp.]|nr:addiction module killer protein [Rhizobium sp.]